MRLDRALLVAVAACIACGPPSLPARYDGLAAPSALAIHDAWGGLGPTHDLAVHLERRGDRYEGKAGIARHQGVEPTEHAASVPAAEVEAFLRVVAAHGIDPKQDYDVRPRWTDDFPSVHLVVTVPGHAATHLGYDDQHRHWRIDGRYLSPDPAPEKPEENGWEHHARINAAYQRLLGAMGAPAWKEALGPR